MQKMGKQVIYHRLNGPVYLCGWAQDGQPVVLQANDEASISHILQGFCV